MKLFLCLLLAMLTLCSCDRIAAVSNTSVEVRLSNSLRDIRNLKSNSRPDPAHSIHSEVERQLSEASVESLERGITACHSHRHITKDVEVVIVVHWIAGDPDVEGFLLRKGNNEFRVPVHPVDAESSSSEAEHGVVFSASVRDSDLAVLGIDADLAAMESITIESPEGDLSNPLTIHDYP
ncbi:MAG: hypothetical protein AAGA55_00480 [Planctomycetota bacterium]